MNGNYKKMMAQHGGYIPFSVLGGSSKGNASKSNSSKSRSSKSRSSKRTSRVRKNTGRMKTEKKVSRLNTNKYAIGTIIRKNNQLVMLSNQRQWQPVKFI